MSYKKKILSLALVSLMFISVGCSKAEGEVKEDVKVEIAEKSNTDIIKQISTEYANLSKYVLTNVYTFEDLSGGLIDEYLTTELPTEPQTFINDTSSFIDSISNLVYKREENNIQSGDTETQKEFYDFVIETDKFIQTYIPEYDDSFLDNAKLYIAENPYVEQSEVEFINVQINEEDMGYTFVGEVKNNNPNQTFSGFAEVALYKDDQVIDTMPIVVNDTSPNGTSVFKTLYTNKGFDGYKIYVTSSLWE